MLWLLLACARYEGPPQETGLADAYPRPLLVSAAAPHPDVQWLDVRPEADWAAGHVPGAAQVRWTDLAGYDADGVWTAAEVEAAAALLAERGLRAGVPIVVYDDWSDSWGGDGFLYWTLRQMGIPDVQVLNGGWDAWVAVDGPMATDTPPPGDLAPLGFEDVQASTEEVQAALEAGTPMLLDVRSAEEYEAGHIPGAHWLEYTRALHADGRLRTPEDLADLLADAGLGDPDAPVITYCAGGIRAGHTFFVLELMGYTQVQDYVGSWRAWTAAGGAVESDAVE
ncbi:MAG: sulfurtransferase [Alphaproteobacteria bacterium]|nr:sulfurtransferase [Alphaproteobacteria bacterium]